jgi:hypothetical protein
MKADRLPGEPHADRPNWRPRRLRQELRGRARALVRAPGREIDGCKPHLAMANADGARATGRPG